MNGTERAWAEINLDAISHNVKQIKSRLNPKVELMGVVKADAYGHGVVETAKTILESGADRLAVAFIDEAVQLRKCGFKIPILILGNTVPQAIDELLEYDITPTVFTVDFAKELSAQAVKINKTAKIHIKVDTGMFRIGFVYTSREEEMQQTIDSIIEISKLPNIEIEGIFTHLSTADEADCKYSKLQFDRFCSLTKALSENGIEIPVKHVANSAAQLKFPEMQLDMVRAGIILYGLFPSDEVSPEGLDLMPAMKFKSRIINLKTIEKGDAISYGRSFEAKTAIRLATVAAGYADGYSRVLSDKAEVSVHGQKVKQIGRICMDQCMIDVTNVNNINIGDEVTLFGDSVVTAEDIAEKMGTINYEAVCMVGKRIPRIYIKDGKTAKSCNYLLQGQ